MAIPFIGLLIPLFAAGHGVNDTIVTATLVQEKFRGGFYLESGVRIGSGDVFFHFRDDQSKAIREPDTVYVFNNYGGECFRVDRADKGFECLIRSVSDQAELEMGSPRLRRRLSRASFHSEGIRAMSYRVVQCRFVVCGVTRGTHAFINYEHRRKNDALVVLREVVVVHISCP